MYPTSTPTYGFHNVVLPIPEEGGGSHCREEEKGHGAEREREKLEGEGGGGAEETSGQNPHSSPALPEGQLPAGDERSDHKVELHSPFREQRDLVIVRSDQENREVCEKSIILVAHKGISGSGVFANFNGPGLVFGQSKFPEHHHPYENGNPL